MLRYGHHAKSDFEVCWPTRIPDTLCVLTGTAQRLCENFVEIGPSGDAELGVKVWQKTEETWVIRIKLEKKY